MSTSSRRPRSASARAQASPMPPAPPVITRTLFTVIRLLSIGGSPSAPLADESADKP
ncbi:hypothetical protein U8D42_27495 (plasmid) [Mycobacterium europaeum]|uniref:hypothetical protein n=1 Tax=Mycobacterium europaeum TaxID=761804 RepID=UPI002AE073A8|nr:hypothetical protein [Mycobacterium europaeum]MEA1161386.1 hypothetical protein [Mycobacterium europaeum]